MLVLTRKRHEVIQIGNDIRIKVIRTGRSAVKIGIEAPGHVRVLRGELSEERLLVQADGADAVALDEETEDLFGCSDQYPHAIDGLSQAV